MPKLRHKVVSHFLMDEFPAPVLPEVANQVTAKAQLAQLGQVQRHSAPGLLSSSLGLKSFRNFEQNCCYFHPFIPSYLLALCPSVLRSPFPSLRLLLSVFRSFY